MSIAVHELFMGTTVHELFIYESIGNNDEY